MNNTESARITAAVRRMAARGKTQHEISLALGISQSTVSRILGKDESEDTPPTRMIAKANKIRDLEAEFSRAYDAGDSKRCEALRNDVATLKASLKQKN